MNAIRTIGAIVGVLALAAVSLYFCTAGARNCEQGQSFNVDTQRCEWPAP